jgi:hypothetical protein
MEMQPLSLAGWLRPALMAIALVYAFLAGLHTVSETDLGWQMATGRYIVQHHQIPSTTLFTYTVPDSTWIYPPFPGVIFYLLYLIGGYSALSWFSALACTATVALAVWRGGSVTAALAILAVPAIAFRIVPRADLFTTVLFAAVLVLLARYYEGHPVRLWPLPVLMLLWVNLHHGFVAGLALMGAYVFSEVCDLLFVIAGSPPLHGSERSCPGSLPRQRRRSSILGASASIELSRGKTKLRSRSVISLASGPASISTRWRSVKRLALAIPPARTGG